MPLISQVFNIRIIILKNEEHLRTNEGKKEMIEFITQDPIFQNTISQAIFLIIGFAVLIKGADIFVNGASNVAYNFKIPTIIVGLTIVAFGTSAPEAAVSVASAMQNNTTMAISNVVGSNTFNILGVIGVSALIGTLTVDKVLIKRDFPFLIISTIGLLLVAIFYKKIDFLCGIIFLIIILTYVYYIVKKEKEDKKAMAEKANATLTIPKAAIYIIIGLIGIIIGSELVAGGASSIAKSFGMTEKLVGLTILAIGTSLPELATSISSLRKGDNGMVIGNVLGSNIFNILFILGLTGVVSSVFAEIPLKIAQKLLPDIFIMTILTIICAWFTYTKSEVDKKEGAVLVALFLLYMAFTILREYNLI